MHRQAELVSPVLFENQALKKIQKKKKEETEKLLWF